MSPLKPPVNALKQRHEENHWELLRYRLLWAHESEKLPSESMAHATDEAPNSLWYLVNGSCRLVQAGMEITANPGEWIFPTPGRRGRYFAPGTRILSVGFMARWPNGEDLIQFDRPLLLKHPGVEELTTHSRELVARVEATVGSGCDWRKSQLWPESLSLLDHFGVEGTFRVWLGSLVAITAACGAHICDLGGHDERVDAALAALAEWPANQALDMSEIASKAGVSRRRLEDLFKEQTGQGIAAFYEQIHLKRVCHMLLDENRQIKEIAGEAGFSHSSNFSRWFRHHTGMTPLEFRASHPTEH